MNGDKDIIAGGDLGAGRLTVTCTGSAAPASRSEQALLPLCCECASDQLKVDTSYGHKHSIVGSDILSTHQSQFAVSAKTLSAFIGVDRGLQRVQP